MPSEAKLNSNIEVVRKLTDDLKNAKGAVLVDYRGINVSQDTELRAALRKAGVKYAVVKNTMTRLAIKEVGLTALESALVGPSALATSSTDAVAPARVMAEYAKKIDKLKIKAGIVEGTVVDVAGVQTLADMPSKETLIAMMLGMMVSPISGLVNVLNANIRGLAVVLNAIAEKKAKDTPEPAPAA